MGDISSGLVESLKTLGLTEYEAKVYAALILFDQAEARQIYEYLDAPKPSVYQSLRSLTDKGLVQMVNSRPALYRATPPKIAIEHMMEAHRKAEESSLAGLEELEKTRAGGDYPDVLWTLYGQENVQHKIEEMFGKVERSLELILPREYLGYLRLLQGKKVEVKLIVFGKADASTARSYGLKNIVIHDMHDLDPAGLQPILIYFQGFPLPEASRDKFLAVRADGMEFMYIPPIPATVSAGMTSRNPFVLALADRVYRIVWDRTS